MELGSRHEETKFSDYNLNFPNVDETYIYASTIILMKNRLGLSLNYYCYE